jgi:nucleoside-diphosphate-sugar epimerase
MFVRADIRDFLRTWFESKRPDFADVIHLASIVGGRTKIERDPVAVAADFAIDSDLFLWATQARPGRVLYASSSAAYPINLQSESGAVALKEEFIRFDGSLGQPDMTYGWAKVTGEYLARLTAEHYGIKTACVRPFSGYGEDQDLTYPIPAIARRAACREDPLVIWGSGKQGRDFVHIDDCVEAMFLALDKISDGTAVNIGSGVLTSFDEIARTLADIAGYAPEIQPLVNQPTGVHARYADVRAAREILGWRPKISLIEGLTRVYETARLNEERSK